MMRVLVTRPEPGAHRTAQKIAARGHEAILMPLTQAIHNTDAAIAALHQPFAAIAVTSAEAARVISRPSVARLIPLDCRFYAVGNASGEALREAGYNDVSVSGGNATDLAALIARNWRGDEQNPLIYLTGTPRTGTLEAGLEVSGIPHHICECYQMRQIERTRDEQIRILSTQPDAALFYSREAARVFFTLDAVKSRPELVARTRLMCLSAAVASVIPQSFTNNIFITRTPEEADLLAAL